MVDCNGNVIRKIELSMNKIGRTLFIRLVGSFPKGQQRNPGCVDYMLDTLVNGNLECVENIIKKRNR